MKTAKQALQWEKVHVFISSTFNDMHAERDYLVKRVFPELQDWCERRKLRLVDIDLRWGITEQDATHNKNVVKVCLDRIDDCRPFFLCFLGQRRGWVPKAGEISDDTFATFPGLRPVVGVASVTELEILHAFINPFHQSLARKTNKRAEYYERAKYAFFYLRDRSYLDRIPRDPTMLRETYTNEWVEDEAERAAHDAELERWREQEIPESNCPSHLYQANWDPNETTPELMIPLQCPSSDPANIRRWQAQWRKAGVTAAGLNLMDDQVEAAKAEEFNARLSTGRLSDLKCDEAPLSHVIIKELQDAISERFHEHTEVTEESELQKEIDQHEQFLFMASEGFIPRTGDFAELDEYVESDSKQLFVLTAEGGMGKSTLLANWVDRFRQRIAEGTQGHGDHSIHFRFIGQSDGTTTVYSLLRLLLHEIKEVAQKFAEEIPLDPIKLRNEWPALLEAIGKRGLTVIVIDALNQLDTGLSDVGWLPRQLPANIKLIVSFKRGDEAAEKLYERYREGNQARLSSVQPFAELDDRRRLVLAYLSHYLKELDQQQLEALINLHGAKNPLYLKVVLSELRVFGAYGNLTAKIRSDFGDTPVSAFSQVLKRLETDPSYSPIDPKQAVPLLFGLLAHARRGLSVDELTSLFIQALQLEESAQSREDATDTVNLFLRQVRSFQARREGRYDFFFESFRTAAQQCYVAKGAERRSARRSAQEWHGLLANYFRRLPTWQRVLPSSIVMQPQLSREPTQRKVAELPYHLTHAHEWAALEETLCALDFIEAKCAAGMTFDLVTDYDVALASVDRGKGGAEKVRLSQFSRFVQGQAHILSIVSAITFQQAANQPDTSDVAKAAKDRLDSGKERRAWVESVNKPQQMDPCLLTLTGHQSAISTCAWSPDGKWIATSSYDRSIKIWNASNGSLRLTLKEDASVLSCAWSLDGKKIYSYSEDNQLKVWDSLTGVCRQSFTNPQAQALTCAWSPDRLNVAVGLGDKTVTIINSETGRRIKRIAGYNFALTHCEWSPDGNFLATSSQEEVVRILDPSAESPQGDWTSDAPSANTKNLSAVLKYSLGTYRSNSVRSTAWSPDGRWLSTVPFSSAHGNELRIFDVETQTELGRLTLSGTAITSCAWNPNAGRIVVATEEGKLEVWAVHPLACQSTLRGHEGSVNSVAMASDGRIFSGSADRSVRVWAPITGEYLQKCTGHTDEVTSVTQSREGKWVFSGSRDGNVRLWESQTGRCIRIFEGHRGPVNAVASTSDGRTTVSASDDESIRVWNGETGQCLHELKGHTDCVKSVVLTADGRRVVSAGFDRTIRIWNIETAECLKVFRTEGGRKQIGDTIVWRQDQPYILAGVSTNTLFLWDALTSKCRLTLQGHQDEISAASLSPRGAQAISAAKDNTIRLWDLRDGSCIRTWPEETLQNITAVCLRADGQWAAAAGEDSARDTFVKVWNVSDGQVVNVFKVHRSDVYTLLLSPEGKQVFTGGSENLVMAWNVVTGKQVNLFPGHTAGVKALTFTSDSQRIISASEDQTLRVWDARSAVCVKVLQGHGKPLIAVATLPDGRSVASLGSDGTVRVWDWQTGESQTGFEADNYVPSMVNSVVMTPNAERIVYGGWENSVSFWEPEQPDPSDDDLSKSFRKEHKAVVRSVCLSTDGQQIVSGSDDRTVRLARITDSELLNDYLNVLGIHDEPVRAVAMSHDGSLIVSGSGDKTLRLWERRSNKLVNTLTGHTDSVNSCVWSPDGKEIVSGALDGEVKVWEAESLQPVAKSTLSYYVGTDLPDPSDQVVVKSIGRRRGMLETPTLPQLGETNRRTLKIWDQTNRVAIATISGRYRRLGDLVEVAPDGQKFSQADGRKNIKIVYADGRDLILCGHAQMVTCCAWSPDSKLIASSSDDRTIRIWDAATGSCLKTLAGHKYMVTACVWSPTGEQLMSASYDTTLKVWDLRSGACLATLTGHGDAVNSCAWSPDGKWLASVSNDKTLRVWNLERELEVARFVELKAYHTIAAGSGGWIIVGDSLNETRHIFRVHSESQER